VRSFATVGDRIEKFDGNGQLSDRQNAKIPAFVSTMFEPIEILPLCAEFYTPRILLETEKPKTNRPNGAKRRLVGQDVEDPLHPIATH